MNLKSTRAVWVTSTDNCDHELWSLTAITLEEHHGQLVMRRGVCRTYTAMDVHQIVCNRSTTET